MGKKVINPLLEVKNKGMNIINPYILGSSIPRNGLIAEYLFSGNANDTSGNFLNGTVNGSPSLVADRKGNLNSAYLFHSASSDFINIPDNNLLDFTTAFSISLWIYKAALNTDQTLIAKWDIATQGCFALQTSNLSSSDLKIFIASSLTDGGSNYALTSTMGLVINTWQHIVVVYDGTQASGSNRIKFYKNAVFIPNGQTTGIAPSLINCSASLKIGKFGGALTRYFNGNIDDIRLYNRVLTQDEITLLYNE